MRTTPNCKPAPVVSLLLIASMFFSSSAIARPEAKASLVLTNGNVVTLDEDRPVAQAVAVHGDTILAVGSNEDIRTTLMATRRLSTWVARRSSPLHREPRPLHGTGQVAHATSARAGKEL